MKQDKEQPETMNSEFNFPVRNYQLEAFEKAKKKNTIVYLETGSGKTLVAIMLLRHYACRIRKPASSIAVFLVPTVVLVKQQAEAITSLLDLKVGMYWGDMGVDFWDAKTWEDQTAKNEVLVMTPQILLDCLRHSFIKMEMIKVMIIDECHHAKRNHAYACIMTEFYHRHLESGCVDLPRILGLTASLIKSRISGSDDTYWNKIEELEDMLNSKVYTCTSDSEIVRFVPQSSPSFVYYEGVDSPNNSIDSIIDSLKKLELKHELSIDGMNLSDSDASSSRKELSKRCKTLKFCLEELGLKLAIEAAKYLSGAENYFVPPGGFRNCSSIIRNFTSDAYQVFSNFSNNEESVTAKVHCLCNILLAHRDKSDIRCIVFVERVITAVVLESLLSSLLQKHSSWKLRYIAGSQSKIQSPTEQNDIIKEFREGKVNVIIATSILEEGLDVQSCNLVIRFDPPPTMSSLIQSRGRARTMNSNYIVMVKRDDHIMISKMEEHLAGAEKMRKASLIHADDPCSKLLKKLDGDNYYTVESTGAIATLNSSVATVYFYCSRLPSDAYFKPAPRFSFDEINHSCTMHLPSSSPVHNVVVHGAKIYLKEKACLEAIKQLHAAGALTDYLVPDIVVEEGVAKEEAKNKEYEKTEHDCPIYYPAEFVREDEAMPPSIYYFYLIKLKQNFEFEHSACDVVLAMKTQLDSDFPSWGFELNADAGSISVELEFIGELSLPSELVSVAVLFQTTLFRVLLDHKFQEIEVKDDVNPNFTRTDYLLLPAKDKKIDWFAVFSVMFRSEGAANHHQNCTRFIHTKIPHVCGCMLANSIAYAPHNGYAYYITGTLDYLNGRSLMVENASKSYYEHFKTSNITLSHEDERLVRGRQMFTLQNHLGSRNLPPEGQGSKNGCHNSPNAYVELPPELLVIIMHPISINTVYSFSFLPSIMHRIESLIIASSLKKFHLDDHMHDVVIPTTIAITTKKCQEEFNLESLETIGDSFLKYASCQYLFNTHRNLHEGHLALKKDKLVSNSALCLLARNRNLPGFIRSEQCNPKNWRIPGEYYDLKEEALSDTKRCYVGGTRQLKTKRIADVAESLIGAYLTKCGETAALVFMHWLGIKVDLNPLPFEPHLHLQVDQHINVAQLQELLNYTFKNPSLLLEALTHGSYMMPEVPTCYQRLEFLGDAVLDYLITKHMFDAYSTWNQRSIPKLLTELRSASTNNNCYARCSIKSGLHKHLVHASALLYREMLQSLSAFQNSSVEYTFGCETEINFPKVLGDIMESVAGAIYIDSGYNKEAVYSTIVPLLQPLVSPATLRRQPSRVLKELCQKQHFQGPIKKILQLSGEVSVSLMVTADGATFKSTVNKPNKKIGLDSASKQILHDIITRFPHLQLPL